MNTVDYEALLLEGNLKPLPDFFLEDELALCKRLYPLGNGEFYLERINLIESEIEARLTRKTEAIIVVHVLADDLGVTVIEAEALLKKIKSHVIPLTECQELLKQKLIRLGLV